MDSPPCIAWLVYFCLLWYCIEGLTVDPCVQHETFTEDYLGSRNEKCPRPNPAQRLCDYRLHPAWYLIPHNGYLINKCPTSGECGTEFPVWMQGDVPSVADGIVNRTGCIQMRCDCCADNVTIQVKNCTNKIVYYLPTLSYCDSVYCMGTSLPCETTTTTVKTTTTSTVTPRLPLATTTTNNTTDSDCEECQCLDLYIYISVCIATFILGGAIGVVLTKICDRYRCQKKIGDSDTDLNRQKPPPPYGPISHEIHRVQKH